MIKIEVKEDPKKIIDEQKEKGLYLIEVQDHFSGKYLIFDTAPKVYVPPVTIESLAARIAVLEAKDKEVVK